MRLRLLRVIRSVNPKGGGPIEGVKQVSRVLEGDGHEVEVVSLDRAEDTWVSEFPFRCHAVGESRGGYGYSSKLIPWLRTHAHRFDAVVVHGLWQYHALAVWRALAGTVVPYFVYPHGMLDPWFKQTYPLKHLKKWLYWPWADYRVLRDARAVLFTSEEERLQARKSFWLYRANERVVNYGTAGPIGDSAKQRALFLESFPHLAGRRCLLFLGRVHVKKGADLLLKAFAASALTRNSTAEAALHLVIGGPDDHAYAAEMKSLAKTLGIADRVTWTAMLTGDMKWGAFHHAEVFVLPSHQENFGIAVAEALACAAPVLISNRVNIWREIAGDGAGFMADDTLEGTKSLLGRWLTLSPAEIERYRANARACFERRFHIRRAAESLEAVVTGAITDRTTDGRGLRAAPAQ